MAISKKIKTISNKIEKNIAQYDFEKETAKISALSSLNVCKYEFLTGKGVFPENNLLKRAAAIKRFEYSLLSKELKAQTDITKDQYKFFKDQKNYAIDNMAKESDEDKWWK